MSALGDEPHVDLTGGRGLAAMPDPDLDFGPSSTMLDELRAELAEEVASEEVTYEVPGRKGWTVTYGADIPGDQLVHWRRKAADRTQPAGFDQIKWACIVLASQCRSLQKNGEVVSHRGEPLTFRSPELQSILGLSGPEARAVMAVRKFYGRDGAILTTVEQLLGEAGYGEEVEKVDPTRRSSSDS